MNFPVISPEQVKWIVDHNEQIRGSHRVQLLDASQAWADDRELLAAAEAKLERIAEADPSSMVLTIERDNGKVVTIYIGWQWLTLACIAVGLAWWF